MEKIIVEFPEVKLVGLVTERTNNAAEAGSLDGKIFLLVKKYFHGGVAQTIAHRKKPGTTYCAFTEYDPFYVHENKFTIVSFCILIADNFRQFYGINFNTS